MCPISKHQRHADLGSAVGAQIAGESERMGSRITTAVASCSTEVIAQSPSPCGAQQRGKNKRRSELVNRSPHSRRGRGRDARLLGSGGRGIAGTGASRAPG
jgi:hypothetical protein